MATTFQNALNLSGSAMSLSFENKYLGQNYGSYGRTKTIGFRGVILPTGQYSGISTTFSTYEQIKNSAHDSCATNTQFSINGRNFGSGKVLSVSFEERENPITVGSYDMELLIYESGGYDSTQATDIFSSDLSSKIAARRPHLIDNIDESFSFNREEDGSFSLTHDFSVKYSSGESGFDYVAAAQQLASGFYVDLGNLPDYGFFGDTSGLYNDTYLDASKFLYNESYDLVGLNFSFSKNYNSLEAANKAASERHAINIQRDEQGYFTVSENGEIKANDNLGSTQLFTTLNSNISGARNSFSRCNGLFNSVSGYAGSSSVRSLYTGHTEFGYNLNEKTQTLSYNVSYTNNPRFTSSGIHEFTQALSEDKLGGSITITENGSFRPYGNKTTGFDAITAIKNMVNTNAPARIRTFGIDHNSNWLYSTNFSNHAVIIFDGTTNGDIQQRTNFSIEYPRNGSQVGYSCQYVVNGEYLSDADQTTHGINKCTVEVQDTAPTLQRTTQLVPGFKEIIQELPYAQQTQLGTRSITVSAQKIRNGNYLLNVPNVGTQLSYMFDRAIEQMLRLPSEIDNTILREMFVQNVNYTFNSDGTMTLNFEVGFTAASFDDKLAGDYHTFLKSSSQLPS
tara:strand:+ start:918 stop:2786 length:1869 start_codon:yes stop_codon:yes gene_type:complete